LLYPWSFCISASLAFIAYFEGKWLIFSTWCVHVSTSGRDRSHNSKKSLLSACIHLGDCICLGGVASELLLLDVLSLDVLSLCLF
jgi:hypothetical protein